VRYSDRVDAYDPGRYAPVAVTVDLVVLTVRGDQLRALVIRRGEAPYKGRWALPGGFVQPDEDLDHAAARELAEETGLTARQVHIEQLASYGAPKRDPRMRVITVAYLALAPDLPMPHAGSDAAEAHWRPIKQLVPDRLAFDHNHILTDGIERARAKLEYTSLAAAFCPPEFTVAELRHIYEIVWDTPLDPRNFHRKATKTPGFLTPTANTTTRDGGRPAQLYRQGPNTLLHPPLLRTEA
jgi:8-oxo-dGTP diphosphatase